MPYEQFTIHVEGLSLQQGFIRPERDLWPLGLSRILHLTEKVTHVLMNAAPRAFNIWHTFIP